MNSRLQINFRGMERSSNLEQEVRAHCEHLEGHHGLFSTCHVTVELPHHHHQKGNVYQVRIHATLPGFELVVGHDPARDHAHEDPYVAVRDAFLQAERQLESREGRMRPRRAHG